MSERVSIKREAEVACEIHDLTYRGKQVPAGHARALTALLNARGLLAPESGEPSPCAGCGGDGVQIDDDPESTRQIVSTCGECRGSGSNEREQSDG